MRISSLGGGVLHLRNSEFESTDAGLEVLEVLRLREDGVRVRYLGAARTRADSRGRLLREVVLFENKNLISEISGNDLMFQDLAKYSAHLPSFHFMKDVANIFRIKCCHLKMTTFSAKRSGRRDILKDEE